MGRAKLPIKLISNEKSRKVTFLTRRQGLKKKTLEFSTLCGVDACLICFGPSGEDDTWPENKEEVTRIIKRYKQLPKQDREKRKMDLSSFLEEKKKKIEGELAQTRRENSESLYPTWYEGLNDLSEDALRGLVTSLDAKLEMVRSRVETLKGKQIAQGNGMGISVQPIHFSTNDFKPFPLSCRMPLDHLLMAPDYPINPMGFEYGIGSWDMFQEEVFSEEIVNHPIYYQKEVWDYGYPMGGAYFPHVQPKVSNIGIGQRIGQPKADPDRDRRIGSGDPSAKKV